MKEENFKYQYDIKIKKRPEDHSKMISNYMHPDHHIFTYEYGWIRLDELYSMYRKGTFLNILQFDLTDWKMYYTKVYKVVTGTPMHGVHHYRHDNIKRNKSDIELLVYKYTEIIVSLDGESLTRMRSMDYAREFPNTNIKERSGKFITMNTIRSFHDGLELDFSDGVKRTPMSYTKGLLYGIVNQTGALLTMLNGNITLVGCYDFSADNYKLWQ